MLILIEVHLHYFHTRATRQAQRTRTPKKKKKNTPKTQRVVTLTHDFKRDMLNMGYVNTGK